MLTGGPHCCQRHAEHACSSMPLPFLVRAYLYGRFAAILRLQQPQAVEQVQDHHIPCHDASSVLRQRLGSAQCVLTTNGSVLSRTRCEVR